MGTDAKVIPTVPPVTLGWLLEPESPAVAVLTRRTLLGEPDSWDVPSQDYRKHGGSLWQIVCLGEMYASGGCHRVQRGAAYAFSRQLPGGARP